MLAVAVVIFREVLEAALIISIVCAATRGVPGRSVWVSGGVAAGVLGAILVAMFADVIMQSASGLGQEILNAIILFLAVLMLAWHNIWMASHARELTAQMKAVGTAVKEGRQELMALLVVVGLAVLREGSEIVLFVHGIFAGGTQMAQMLTGSVAGLVAGAAVGLALYFGLLRIPARHLFSVTGWMILLLAAGMAAQGAKYLTQAGLLPSIVPRVWDTSAILSNHSTLGNFLHVLIGYDAKPSALQLIFYCTTIVVIFTGMKLADRKPA